ncbi:hypothetical protein FNV43_RR25385 [Rhamnella rubrinervis]|uniref:Uncharacterized protein n=1 Tax=Rhamnella rubrinervis TaxID=2594499 RepID=A0A8K0DN94_9ROSA|nr:hypothetical protein FNV43_RR25385 [Rhamnella rubrinervis]
MMYGDPQQHQHQQQQGGDFHRGPPPPPPPMMRQPSASSTNIAPEYHQPSGPAPPLPPYDAHGDSFAAKRMRKLTQKRAVDYASTVVRYMQVKLFVAKWIRNVKDSVGTVKEGDDDQDESHQLLGHVPMNLQDLDLGSNNVNGTIPSWLYSLPEGNKLHNHIPVLVFQQQNLTVLDLSQKNLSSAVGFDQFSKLKNLERLSLSYTNLSLSFNNFNSYTLPNLVTLKLSSCNIIGVDTLQDLNLSHNPLTSYVPEQLPWIILTIVSKDSYKDNHKNSLFHKSITKAQDECQNLQRLPKENHRNIHSHYVRISVDYGNINLLNCPTSQKEKNSASDPKEWHLRHLILYCRDLLFSNGWSLFWNSRDSNQVADITAKYSLSNFLSFSFPAELDSFSDLPSCIVEAATKDQLCCDLSL